jgi:hypothetical protein
LALYFGDKSSRETDSNAAECAVTGEEVVNARKLAFAPDAFYRFKENGRELNEFDILQMPPEERYPRSDLTFSGTFFNGDLVRSDLTAFLKATHPANDTDFELPTLTEIRDERRKWQAQTLRRLIKNMSDQAKVYSTEEKEAALEDSIRVVRGEDRKIPELIPDDGDDLRDFLWEGMRPINELAELLQNLSSKSKENFAQVGVIEPAETLRYLNDSVRTKKWITAEDHCLTHLIDTRLETGKQDSLHVIDAGCGPVPVFAIWAALKDPRINVSAIELHPVSAQIARLVVNKMGLEDQITIVEEDARTWDSKPFDLLVSETLDSGLTQESLHTIVGGLRPLQLPHGLIIPQQVSVDVKVVSRSEVENPERWIFQNKKFHPLTSSTYKTVGSWHSDGQWDGIQNDRVSISISAEQNSQENYLCLSSTVLLCDIDGKRLELRPEESFLTRIKGIQAPEEHLGKDVTLSYLVGELYSSQEWRVEM